MKFQILNGHTDGRMHRQAQRNMPLKLFQCWEHNNLADISSMAIGVNCGLSLHL